MEKQFVVYKATNKVNGKIYIGKTYDFEKRKKEHIYDIDNNLPFHKALKKYGLDNFEWEIIDRGNSDKEIVEKEIFWIKKLNTCIHSLNSNGYNITLGGEGGTSWNSRPVVRFDLQGNYIDEFISCACAAVMLKLDRKSIERAAKTKYSSSQGFMWKYKSDWCGEKIEPHKKLESARKIAVVQLLCNGEFVSEYGSLKEASEATGTMRSCISSCLIGQTKRANGYLWVYKSEYDSEKDYSFQGVEFDDKIAQIDKNMKLISLFNNCSEAARRNGYETSAHKTIHRALKSKTHNALGCKWYKYKDYLNIQQGNPEIT